MEQLKCLKSKLLRLLTSRVTHCFPQIFPGHLNKHLNKQNTLGFSSSSYGKASACNAGDPGLIPWLGRLPGEGHGSPLQYSYLENPMDRGAWWATVHGGHKESNKDNTLEASIFFIYYLE